MLKTVFKHISNHLKVRQEYSAARRIFKSLLGVCKCGQTRTSVLDILRKVRTQVIEGIRNSSDTRIFQSNSLMIRKNCPSMYRMDHFTQQINKKSLSWLNVNLRSFIRIHCISLTTSKLSRQHCTSPVQCRHPLLFVNLAKEKDERVFPLSKQAKTNKASLLSSYNRRSNPVPLFNPTPNL